MKFIGYFAFVWAVAAMMGGVGLAYHAWHSGSQSLAMLAAVLLLTAPMLAAATTFALRAAPAPGDVASSGELLDSIRRIDGCLRVVRLCRAHLGVAHAWLFVVWFSQLTGYMRIREFAIFYGVACVVAAAAFVPWLSACEHRLYDDRADRWQRLGEAEAVAAARRSDAWDDRIGADVRL